MRIVGLALLAVVLDAGAPESVCAGELSLTDPEDVGISSERLNRVTQYFEKLVQEGQAAGFQLLVSRRGEVVMHEHIGMADIATDRPVSESTLFRIASMTKPIVGVAMMMLYEEGRYSLQDPISSHIPEFANLKVYAGQDETGAMLLEEPTRPPTIHDLMQHTAGFTYGVFGDTPVDRAYLEADIHSDELTQQEFIERLATLPLLYQPGEQWVYSVATDIQGYLIEKWTGMDLEAFLQERIFGPLDMDETMAWVRPPELPDLATVYTHDESGSLIPITEEVASRATTEPARFSGGGQLVSTSDDYWRFCQMLLNGGVLDGTRLLSPASVRMMTENRLDEPMTIPGWIEEQGFGLNFSVITDPAKVDYPTSMGEYFWAGAFTTVFWVDPGNELIAIMLTQYSPFQIFEYADLFHRLVNSAVMQ